MLLNCYNCRLNYYCNNTNNNKQKIRPKAGLGYIYMFNMKHDINKESLFWPPIMI